MNIDKIQRLEAKGWKVGSASNFLELTPAEATYIELTLALSCTSPQSPAPAAASDKPRNNAPSA